MWCVNKYIQSLGGAKAMSKAIEFPSTPPIISPPSFEEFPADVRYRAYQRMQTVRRKARRG